MNKALLLALCLTVPAAAGALKKKGRKAMEWNGQFGGTETAGHRVVQTQAGWNELWAQVGKPAPAVDLVKNVAVAVFMGPRNTGGYTVVWHGPKTEAGRAVLRYSIAPPKGMALQALTQPWTIRLFEKTEKPLVVEPK